MDANGRRKRASGREEEGTLYAIPMYLWEKAFDAVFMETALNDGGEEEDWRREEVDRLTAESDRSRWVPGLACSRRLALEFWRKCGLLRLPGGSHWREDRAAGRGGRDVSEEASYVKSFCLATADLLESEDFFEELLAQKGLTIAVNVGVLPPGGGEGSFLLPLSFAVGVPVPAPAGFAASLGGLLRVLLEKKDEEGGKPWYLFLDVAVVRREIAAPSPTWGDGCEEGRASFYSSAFGGERWLEGKSIFSEDALRSAWAAVIAADPYVPADSTAPGGILRPALRR